MLVIGRNPHSDPDDINTWGKNAVICDPWANRFYEANQFKLEHEHGNKIQMITSINQETGEISVEDDYLQGTPRIRP